MAPDVPARILVVEDDDDSREAIADLLAASGYAVATARDGEEAMASVEKEPPALIVSDVQMPGIGGFEVVKEVRARPESAGIPIILVSGLDGASRKVTGLDLGADDYLAKPFDGAELLARIRAQLRRAAQHRALDRSSRVDALTGVLNRRGILGVLRRERERSERSGASLSVAVIDIDRFKRINDEHGHAAGDAALRNVARALVANARIADDVGRLGGDELVMVLPDAGEDGASHVAQRLRSMRITIRTEDGEESVCLSVGTATMQVGESVDSLLARADEAMYADKRSRAQRWAAEHAAHH